MKDLSLHLSDILENSARAGASHVNVCFERRGAVLTMQVSDDGPGLPAAIRAAPTDPYATTRSERPAGLGLPLLRLAAEKTGGWLTVESPPGGGVTLRALFHLDHLDAQPVGALHAALANALAAWPAVELTVYANGECVLDSVEIKLNLNGVDCSNPKIHNFIKDCLRNQLTDMEKPAEHSYGQERPGGRVDEKSR